MELDSICYYDERSPIRQAKCPTGVNNNLEATSVAICQSYSNVAGIFENTLNCGCKQWFCTGPCLTTVTAKTCVAFSYKVTRYQAEYTLYSCLENVSCLKSWQGVAYPAGTCIYDGGFQSQPWCSYVSGITADATFAGANGVVNWDFCNCGTEKIHFCVMFVRPFTFCLVISESITSTLRRKTLQLTRRGRIWKSNFSRQFTKCRALT